MAKRKVFTSFHHHGDQRAVDDFIEEFSEQLEVFTDSSVERAADSEDVDYLTQVCRDKIKNTSVTIVMVGKQTGGRKFVDWEILNTLTRKHGLVGIKVPGLSDDEAWLPARLKDNIQSGFSKWYVYPSSGGALKKIIDEAYEADKSLIDNSRKSRSSNSSR